MIHHTTTYGVLPTELEFKLLCLIPDEDGHIVAKDGFKIGNCPRVGTINFTVDELYDELKNAHQEFEEGDDDAGSWCSSVLYVLGWEWI